MTLPRQAMLLGAPVLMGCVLMGCANDAPPPTKTSAAATTTSTTAAEPSSTASASASVSKTPTAPARPLYYERALVAGDLRGRTLRELSLMRNTIYARAGNSFRRPWLNKHFAALDWYKPAEKMDESKITKLDRANAKQVADHDSAITKESLEKRRDVVLARKKADKMLPEDVIELSLLSQRLGTWLGERDENAPPTPLEDHTQLDRLLKIEDLSTFSRRDLRILRNTVFARRGRAFESKVVRSYFEGAAWYKAKADYHNGMLTGIDHKNVAIIRSVETSLGGPLHENPNYGKDGWFFQA